MFTENNLDLASYPGSFYSKNGVTYDKQAGKKMQVSSNAYIALANKKFNAAYYNCNESGINHFGVNIAVNRDIGRFFVKACAEKNYYKSDRIKTVTGRNGSNNFGLAAGINF